MQVEVEDCGGSVEEQLCILSDAQDWGSYRKSPQQAKAPASSVKGAGNHTACLRIPSQRKVTADPRRNVDQARGCNEANDPWQVVSKRGSNSPRSAAATSQSAVQPPVKQQRGQSPSQVYNSWDVWQDDVPTAFQPSGHGDPFQAAAYNAASEQHAWSHLEYAGSSSSMQFATFDDDAKWDSYWAAWEAEAELDRQAMRHGHAPGDAAIPVMHGQSAAQHWPDPQLQYAAACVLPGQTPLQGFATSTTPTAFSHSHAHATASPCLKQPHRSNSPSQFPALTSTATGRESSSGSRTGSGSWHVASSHQSRRRAANASTCMVTPNAVASAVGTAAAAASRTARSAALRAEAAAVAQRGVRVMARARPCKDACGTDAHGALALSMVQEGLMHLPRATLHDALLDEKVCMGQYGTVALGQ